MWAGSFADYADNLVGYFLHVTPRLLGFEDFEQGFQPPQPLFDAVADNRSRIGEKADFVAVVHEGQGVFIFLLHVVAEGLNLFLGVGSASGDIFLPLFLVGFRFTHGRTFCKNSRSPNLRFRVPATGGYSQTGFR